MSDFAHDRARAWAAALAIAAGLGGAALLLAAGPATGLAAGLAFAAPFLIGSLGFGAHAPPVRAAAQGGFATIASGGAFLALGAFAPVEAGLAALNAATANRWAQIPILAWDQAAPFLRGFGLALAMQGAVTILWDAFSTRAQSIADAGDA